MGAPLVLEDIWSRMFGRGDGARSASLVSTRTLRHWRALASSAVSSHNLLFMEFHLMERSSGKTPFSF
jgi:hypothetical protein